MDRYLLELDSATKNRLERLRSHPEEPYADIINRLIDSHDDDASLTREEVGEIRQALRDLKEGRFVPGPQVKAEPAPVLEGWFVPGLQVREEPAPAREDPPATIGDPRAVKDMEALFSGTANQEAPFPETKEEEVPFSGTPKREGRDDPDLARYRSIDVDDDDIHEIDPFDKRGRARTHHLDTL